MLSLSWDHLHKGNKFNYLFHFAGCKQAHALSNDFLKWDKVPDHHQGQSKYTYCIIIDHIGYQVMG